MSVGKLEGSAFSVPLQLVRIISSIRAQSISSRRVYALPWTNFNDAIAQTIYPLSKAEAALRRLFLSDTSRGLKNWQYWFLRYCRSLRYPLVNGLAIWAQSSTIAFDLVRILIASKLNSGDTILALKTLSDWGKHHDGDIDRLSLYVEAHNLGGHKVSDPDFDVRKAAIPFYSGANVREDDFLSQLHYETVKREFIHMIPAVPIPKVGFDDWVRLHTWETSGSSSFGRIQLPSGKTIKPRKNMISMEYTDEEIIAMCHTYKGEQRHSLLIKQEPLKIRLAVASDFITYMWQSYALYLVEDFIYKYPGTSLKEDISKEFLRRNMSCKLMEGRTVVSFDYEKFDHQVRTKSIQGICLPILEYIESKYPELMTSQIEQALYSSWDNQTLTNSLVQPAEEHKVTDGLMSGVRLTSLIGNIWNSNHNLWTAQVVDLDYWSVRGDDSLAIAKSKKDAVKYIQAMSVFGAFGSYSKTLIRQGSGEFLRTMYSPQGTRAYVARALLAAVERKPWSNDPVQPFERLTNVISATRTAVLRGSADVYWPIVARNFRKSYQIDPITLAVPKMLGGLGLWYKPVFNKLIYPPCPTNFALTNLPLPAILPRNLSAAAERNEMKPNEYYWSLMLSDNVRGISDEIATLTHNIIDRCRRTTVSPYSLKPLDMKYLSLIIAADNEPERVIMKMPRPPGERLQYEMREILDRGFLPVLKVGRSTLTSLLTGACPFQVPPHWPDYLSSVFGAMFWGMLRFVGAFYPYARRSLVVSALVAIYNVISRIAPPRAMQT